MKIKVSATKGRGGKYWWVAKDLDNKSKTVASPHTGCESEVEALKVGNEVMSAMLKHDFEDARRRVEDLQAENDVLRADKRDLNDLYVAQKAENALLNEAMATHADQLAEAKRPMFNDGRAVAVALGVAFFTLALAVVCFLSGPTP